MTPLAAWSNNSPGLANTDAPPTLCSQKKPCGIEK
jgi:hypothetical protein